VKDTAMKYPKQILDAALAMARADGAAIKAFAQSLAGLGRCDASLAPIWAEKLRHVFPKIVETLYPDLPVAAGQVLPIDGSVDPADLVWEYYMVDSGAQMNWIDDDGSIMDSAYVKASRYTGVMAEFGGGYEYTIFELERAAKAGMALNTIKAGAVKRAHDEFVQRKWLFGDMAKNMPGLLTHPNIPQSLAALGVGGRHWSVKTGDELITDVLALVDTIPVQSIEQHHAAIVYMPFGMIRRLRSLYIGSTADGAVSFWDRLLKLYSGDDTGQGKVSFRGLNECQASRRPTPDPFPFGGDLMFALPAANSDELAFIRARGLTQRPPQEQDFKVKIVSHAKIGGVKVVRPLAAHIVVFGAQP
jgi:hypothetical protein